MYPSIIEYVDCSIVYKFQILYITKDTAVCVLNISCVSIVLENSRTSVTTLICVERVFFFLPLRDIIADTAV